MRDQRDQEWPAGTRRGQEGQEGPGGPGGARRGQGRGQEGPGGARRGQEGPGGIRRGQERPGEHYIMLGVPEGWDRKKYYGL